VQGAGGACEEADAANWIRLKVCVHSEYAEPAAASGLSKGDRLYRVSRLSDR